MRDIFCRPGHPLYPRALGLHAPDQQPGAEKVASIEGAPPDLFAAEGCAFAARCPYAMALCLKQPPDLPLADGHRAACC